MSKTEKHSGLPQVGTAKKKSKIAVQEQSIRNEKKPVVFVAVTCAGSQYTPMLKGFPSQAPCRPFSSLKAAELSGLLA